MGGVWDLPTHDGRYVSASAAAWPRSWPRHSKLTQQKQISEVAPEMDSGSQPLGSEADLPLWVEALVHQTSICEHQDSGPPITSDKRPCSSLPIGTCYYHWRKTPSHILNPFKSFRQYLSLHFDKCKCERAGERMRKRSHAHQAPKIPCV